ncbi:DMT family transporter [Virgibacillus senegalensis]|uniref:DMT family transporter n=1 Tax=Virgibacillus senegalensis TaxID=1499679 RepID=UPI000AA386F1|nr:EamA family transporter [Virgibacillus senegalensis]
MLMKERMPFLLVIGAAILWGTTGTAQTFAPETAHPVAVGAIRLAVGGGTLLLLLLVFGWEIRLWKGIAWRQALPAMISMACYQPLFFSAVTMTGVAVGTVTAIGSAPVLAGLLELVIYRKRQTMRWGIATLMAVAGCLLLFANTGTVTVRPVGVLLALGAGLSFAIYSLASKQLMETHSALSITALVFMGSALLLAPLLFIMDMTWLKEWQGALVGLHLGVAATSAAYLLFSLGLRRIRSSTAVTLSLAEPLTAAMLGVFLVGETLTGLSWLGMLILLSGMVVLTSEGEAIRQNGKLKENES